MYQLHINNLKILINTIIGINKVISISKIKNNNLIIKNGIENGNRNLEIGLNPHSKGIFFSNVVFLKNENNLLKLQIKNII